MDDGWSKGGKERSEAETTANYSPMWNCYTPALDAIERRDARIAELETELGRLASVGDQWLREREWRKELQAENERLNEEVECRGIVLANDYMEIHKLRAQLRYAVTEARRWRWEYEYGCLSNFAVCPKCAESLPEGEAGYGGKWRCFCGMTWRAEGPRLGEG